MSSRQVAVDPDGSGLRKAPSSGQHQKMSELRNRYFKEMGITSDVIRDIANTKIGYSALFFYLWVSIRYQSRGFTVNGASRAYGKHRRTVFRYLAKLQKADMIEQVFEGAAGEPAIYRIVEADDEG